MGRPGVPRKKRLSEAIQITETGNLRHHQRGSVSDGLRTMRRFQADNGRWVLKDGTAFADLVALPDPWPPKEPGQ